MKPVPMIALIASLLLPTFSNAAPLPSTVSATTRRSAEDSAELAPATMRVLSTSDTAILLALDTPAYQVSQMKTAQGDFDTIQVADYAMTQEPGQPQLPMQASLIAIPPGASVTAEVMASDGRILSRAPESTPNPAPGNARCRSGGPGGSRCERPAFQPDSHLRIQPHHVERR